MSVTSELIPGPSRIIRIHVNPDAVHGDPYAGVMTATGEGTTAFLRGFVMRDDRLFVEADWLAVEAELRLHGFTQYRYARMKDSRARWITRSIPA